MPSRRLLPRLRHLHLLHSLRVCKLTFGAAGEQRVSERMEWGHQIGTLEEAPDSYRIVGGGGGTAGERETQRERELPPLTYKAENRRREFAMFFRLPRDPSVGRAEDKFTDFHIPFHLPIFRVCFRTCSPQTGDFVRCTAVRTRRPILPYHAALLSKLVPTFQPRVNSRWFHNSSCGQLPFSYSSK